MDKKTKKLYDMSFSTVYPLYLAKVIRKGQHEDSLKTLIIWLTGYSEERLEEIIVDPDLSFEVFFKEAPQINPKSKEITGVICGVRVEDIEDDIIQKIRYLDKIVDDLAKGKSLKKIMRES